MKPAWAYLALMAGTLSIPLLFSFSRRLGFGPRWKSAWAAVAVSALPFLAWDILFTRWGIWGFNPEYMLGPSLFGLPLEEILFFFCVPFACLFIYQALARLPALREPAAAVRFAWAAGAVALPALALFYADRAYTLTVSLAACGACAWLSLGNPAWSGRLLAATAAQYIPFAVVNGFLTGLPVVIYNGAEITGFRIGTIPAEDFLYTFLLLALPVALYEARVRPGRAG